MSKSSDSVVVPDSILPPSLVSAVLTVRVAPVHRRFAISALPERDGYRVVTSHLPQGTLDGSASVRAERVPDLPTAIDRLLERLIEVGTQDAERLHQSVGQAFLAFTFGRPGIRARSPVARARLHQLADLYVETLWGYAEGAAQARACALAHGVGHPERLSPPWLAAGEADVQAQRSLSERREALIRSLQRSVASAT